MSYRDQYEFDPQTDEKQGGGGLLGRLQALMQQGQADADSGPITEETFAYDPETYNSPQGGLIGRLTELQQRQDQYRPLATQSGGLADQIVQAESHGVSNAENPYSSARGAGQFIKETWLAMLRMHRPDLTGTPEELPALRNNPKLAAEMTEALATDNARILSNAGYEATPRNVYLAHFAGPSRAVAVLNADPNASVKSVLGAQAIVENPFLEKMSIGDMRAWADRKMRAASVRISKPTPPPFPERADPIFSQQASRATTSPRLVGTIANDPSRLLSPRPLASQLGIDLANDTDALRPPPVGLFSGEPMQHWMLPISGPRR
jgi:hypothetical protein